MSVDESLSDFSEIFQEYYDQSEGQLKELALAFVGMHEFFSETNDTASESIENVLSKA